MWERGTQSLRAGKARWITNLFPAQLRAADVGIKNLCRCHIDRVLQHHVSISKVGGPVGGVGGRSANPRARAHFVLALPAWKMVRAGSFHCHLAHGSGN